jgi:hypothetical protein
MSQKSVEIQFLQLYNSCYTFKTFKRRNLLECTLLLIYDLQSLQRVNFFYLQKNEKNRLNSLILAGYVKLTKQSKIVNATCFWPTMLLTVITRLSSSFWIHMLDPSVGSDVATMDARWTGALKIRLVPFVAWLDPLSESPLKIPINRLHRPLKYE